MAADLVSSPFAEEARLQEKKKKKRRLGWDVADPALLAVATRLQLDVAAQLLQIYPTLLSTQDLHPLQAVDSSYGIKATDGDSICQHGPSHAKRAREKGTSESRQSPSCDDDDDDGHLNYVIENSLTSRYKILRKIGEGTFGRVFECWDRVSLESVAIKVVRSIKKYREDAMVELQMLCTLDEKDKTGSRGCVQLKRWFDYRNHVCIVFEKLGPSLYEFLRSNDYRPFSLDLVRDFGRQMLESVAYIHSLGLIHTDLKPENVLLVTSEYFKVVDQKKPLKCSAKSKRVPKSSQIKVIDFGSTTFDRDCSFSVVSTRHYRAPEVILGCGWSYPCDIWSVGCILLELCSGKVLFQTREDVEHLAMMERVIGHIPSSLIKRCTGRARTYFKHSRRLDWPSQHSSRESLRAVHRLFRLRDMVAECAGESSGLLADLLEGLLKYDPRERLTAKKALEHPFFRGSG